MASRGRKMRKKKGHILRSAWMMVSMEEKPSGDTSPATTRVRANPGTAVNLVGMYT